MNQSIQTLYSLSDKYSAINMKLWPLKRRIATLTAELSSMQSELSSTQSALDAAGHALIAASGLISGRVLFGEPAPDLQK